MSKRELHHAKLYARELTKVYLLDYYRNLFPHVFQNATLETRPATSEDYYIPSSLADQCIVVVKTQLDKKGCQTMGCFPYKQDLVECEDTDLPRWIPMGQDFIIGCAPICKEQTNYIDTEWKNNLCRSVNYLKKFVAVMPEKLFERTARQQFHGGLDLVEGDLKLNKRYCKAYGLDFEDDDCVSSTAQGMGEFFLGKTIYRAIKTQYLKPISYQYPAKLPDYLNYKPVQRRIKRASADPAENHIALEIAKDLAIDASLEVSEMLVANVLKKKAPKLLTGVIQNIAVKTALQEVVKNSIIQASTSALRILGTGVQVIGAIHGVFAIVADILDSIDPYDFNRVLNKDSLASLNQELDYKYFGEEGLFPEVTPEYIWTYNLLNVEDESERYIFMAEKIQEYLDALHHVPEEEMPRTAFDREKITQKIEDRFNGSLHGALLFFGFTFMILFIQWIHVWALILFFGVLYFYNTM